MTPLMKQFWAVKERYKDCVLFFRMGDFYELFGDDAVMAARILGITLTQRNNGSEAKTPLCGFPYHAAERYVPKMVKAGYKVAICEQIEDPKKAVGIVKRDVIEVITPGTALSDSNLEQKSHNYLCSVSLKADKNGIWWVAALDISTGDFHICGLPETEMGPELYRLAPSEVVVSNPNPALALENQELPEWLKDYTELEKVRLSEAPSFFPGEEASWLCESMSLSTLEAFGIPNDHLGLPYAASVLKYATEQKKRKLDNVRSLRIRSFGDYMQLDPQTLRNLELIKPLNHEDGNCTLLSVLDYTSTAMGGRLLKEWIKRPLCVKAPIDNRLDAITELLEDAVLSEDITDKLKEIGDIARLAGKVGSGRVNPKDMLNLGRSLLSCNDLDSITQACKNSLLNNPDLKDFNLLAKANEITETLVDEPPMTVREGKMIRPGISSELDALNEGIRDAREWLNGLESRERQALEIPTLKVGFNKVFGYYLEVGHKHTAKVPENWIRKQTLANAERFITPEMKDYETQILSAEGRINDMEYRIFEGLRQKVNEWIADLMDVSEILAQVDCLSSLAKSAYQNNFSKPTLLELGGIDIQDAWHPVIKRNNPETPFITNNAHFDPNGMRLMLITGPNMAGKSTYLRQTAIVTLMAQLGSYVPAAKAQIGLVDRIFTRVGASDRLSRGQSTFMVEMVETAAILHHCTPRSLILLDEIGRGTSTYDGLSLAWSIVEYLHNNTDHCGMTLFATHYHELTSLASGLEHADNYHISVKEQGHDLVFLRKILQGACDSSYGIQVARMAGVPIDVINRAAEKLSTFEEAEFNNLNQVDISCDTHSSSPQTAEASKIETPTAQVPATQQVDLFSVSPLSEAERKLATNIQKIRIDEMRPLDALNLLAELQESLKG
ncbi:DNA mismatch repair protein MutS [bacterium]|nr:DNA mismatch repair protein MutS [bacterium]